MIESNDPGRIPRVCPIDNCSSSDDYLSCPYLSSAAINLLRNQQKRHKNQDGVSERLDTIVRQNDEAANMLALLASKIYARCPHLVAIIPVDSAEYNDPKQWVMSGLNRKYEVVFYCARSCQPSHKPFQIEVPHEWIVKIAPWVMLSLDVVRMMCTPLPTITHLTNSVSHQQLHSFYNSLMEPSQKIECESIMNQGMIRMQPFVELRNFVGEAYTFLEAKANETETAAIWKSNMKMVYNPKNR
jgi:hypothetical protein